MPSQATGDLRATIATNIRTARLDAELTQAQLAAVLGIESMAISKWERGHHAPSNGNLLALAEHLSRDVGWFYTDHAKSAA
jgi:transcriptional regulator with XRE-family HTH domain